MTEKKNSEAKKPTINIPKPKFPQPKVTKGHMNVGGVKMIRKAAARGR
ncbi:MAG: hypothetical protein IT497_09920 [Ottowia sp.]|nr:hypothetical protein [Ottowia sp.]